MVPSETRYFGRIVGKTRLLVRLDPHLSSEPGGEGVGPGGVLLNARRDLKSYPAQFDWGTGGPGAAQTALALLAHCLGPDRQGEAVLWHQGFKTEVISALHPDREWEMTAGEIFEVLGLLRKRGAEIESRERFEVTVGDPYDGIG